MEKIPLDGLLFAWRKFLPIIRSLRGVNFVLICHSPHLPSSTYNPRRAPSKSVLAQIMEEEHLKK